MLEQVTLYRAPTTVADADVIASLLDDRIDAAVHVRDRFLAVTRRDDIAERFAMARVRSPYERETGSAMLGSCATRSAMDCPERAEGVLYDGTAVQRSFDDCFRGNERDWSHLHVPLLDRALATWGDHDGRWHKRVTVLGQPSLISVPGLYEAPAKPEAYYRERQAYAALSGDVPPREVLEREVDGEFLIEDDPRTTDALLGYTLQAVHLIETGVAFCEEPRGRLYDAHRQPELVRAQLREPEFCQVHAAMYGT